MDDRRDKAIWNCGMWAGLGCGWMVEPLMRAIATPIIGEAPFPIPVFITIVGFGLSVAAGIIIMRRDEQQAIHDANQVGGAERHDVQAEGGEQ